ncbi:nicolin-1 [Halyomorpha halys]|uniref:nicolin-1 n=1 Tax=Halyomorpha halys TaxID=286706 RepID=UPI0006D524F2|nr:nicolin-1-like [Halyomorpha halys]
MDGMYEREAVQFTVKGPIPIKGDDEVDLSGVSAIDITLNEPTTVGELVFRNYYTATIAVLILYDKSKRSEKADRKRSWSCSISQKVLMPNPHLETGSHDVFSITPSDSCIPWNDISVMRLILRQPSPLWITFKIEEVNLFKNLPRIIQRPTADSKELDKLLILLKRQTVSALNWHPSQSIGISVPSNTEVQSSSSSPKQSPSCEQTSGGYEIHRLPYN